jgi:PhnB protein
MTTTYKPDGYASVSVYIMAEGAQRVVDFLVQTFDATTLRRMDNEDGTIQHIELQLDDSVIMLAEAGGDFPAFPVWIHVYVPDVDVAYQRALNAGAVSVQEPVQKGDPDKRSGVKDPTGNVWWISTQVG